jgi:hypothetical protein
MGTATAGEIKMSIFLTMLSNCFVCSDLALSAAGGATRETGLVALGIPRRPN